MVEKQENNVIIKRSKLANFLPRLDQRKATTAIYAFLIFAAVAFLVIEVPRPGEDKGSLIAAIISVPATTLGLFLHLRGWRYSSNSMIIFLALTVGFGLPEPYVSQVSDSTVLVPAVIAALVCKNRLMIWLAMAIALGTLITRAGGKGVYTDPVTLIILSIIVLGLFLIRSVLENTSEARKEADRLRTVSDVYLGSIGDGVVAINRNWHITMFNKAAAKLTGWTAEEAVGQNLRKVLRFVREADRQENITFIEDAMVKGEAAFLTSKTVLIKKDGSEIPVDDSAAPMLYPGTKEVAGAIIVFRDASVARQAAALRSDFGYAAHQLRTPATEAMYVLEAALAEKTIEGMRKQIEASQNSLQSVAKMADGLVIVSQIDQKMIIPKLKEVSISQLCQGLVKSFTEKARVKNAKLVFVPMRQDVVINTDSRLLSDSITELLQNAILYCSPSGQIALKAQQSENKLIISVNNPGKPISGEEQPFIFTKFFRGSNREQSIPGAGLGLYKTRAYVKLVKGTIWFKSDEKAGTTFCIQLPLNNA